MSSASLPISLALEQDVERNGSTDLSRAGGSIYLAQVDDHAVILDDGDDGGLKEEASATAVSDYALPAFLSAPSNRVRRRSELAFARPAKPLPHDERGATIELPILSPDSIEVSQRLPPLDELKIVDEEEILPATTPTDTKTSGGPTSVQSLFYSTPAGSTAVATARTSKHRRLGAAHFAALCWAFFIEGWNDGSAGPLLPTIQSYYHLSFATVSLIFILSAAGFIVGAFGIVPLTRKFGFGRVIVLGAVSQMIAYAMQAPAGPFPLFAASFWLAGYGISLQNALGNTYVGFIKSGTAARLGVLHGSYGLGAFCAPLAATHFAAQTHWSYHYLLSLSLSVTNVVILSAVFRFRTQDAVLQEAGHSDAPEPVNEGGSHLRALLGIRAVHFMTAFVIIYVGVEVTLGGWIVTYIIRERQGGPSSGYISSGFFGGLTLGRVTLLWLNRRIGEARALVLYAVLCIILEITVWVVPSLIENAIAVAIIGVLLGPMFPIVINHSSKILPRWLLSGAVGLIAGFGQAGSAILPFITGLFASKFGIRSLQPFVVSMMGTMTVIWLLVPKSQRRFD